jgi:hypothetical protein
LTICVRFSGRHAVTSYWNVSSVVCGRITVVGICSSTQLETQTLAVHCETLAVGQQPPAPQELHPPPLDGQLLQADGQLLQAPELQDEPQPPELGHGAAGDDCH